MKALKNSLSITVYDIMQACKEKDVDWLMYYKGTIDRDEDWRQFVRYRTLEKMENAELFD